MSEASRVGAVLAAFFAAGAVLAAYLPLWLSDHGLTAAEIGLALGASALARVVGVPSGGWVADRLGRRRLILSAAAAMAAVAAIALPAFDGVGPLLVVTVTLGVSAAMLAPLTDAVTLGLAAQRRLDYGRTRAWGSVAFMLATAGAGALLAWSGSAVVPGLLAGGYGLAALLSLRLPEVDAGSPPLGAATGLWRNAAFRWTLLASALVQGSHAAYYSFAPLLWRQAGIGDSAIGLLIAEGIVVEIGLFVWGRGIVMRLGPARLTAVAASACLIRWTALGFTTDIAALAAIQLLHAGSFACQHLSSMLALGRLPAARAAMAQTLLASLGFSLPVGVLVWLTGALYSGLGTLAFLPMAVVGGSALLTVGPLARAIAADGK